MIMKPISESSRGDILKKMFPHTMKVTNTVTISGGGSGSLFDDVETTEVHELCEVPCSVQCSTAVSGEVIKDEYVILSPCIVMTDNGEPCESIGIDVTMNGRKHSVSMTDILSIDNTEVFRVGNTPIGCKIRVQSVGERWTW